MAQNSIIIAQLGEIESNIQFKDCFFFEGCFLRIIQGYESNKQAISLENNLEKYITDLHNHLNSELKDKSPINLPTINGDFYVFQEDDFTDEIQELPDFSLSDFKQDSDTWKLIKDNQIIYHITQLDRLMYSYITTQLTEESEKLIDYSSYSNNSLP